MIEETKNPYADIPDVEIVCIDAEEGAEFNKTPQMPEITPEELDEIEKAEENPCNNCLYADECTQKEAGLKCKDYYIELELKRLEDEGKKGFWARVEAESRARRWHKNETKLRGDLSDYVEKLDELYGYLGNVHSRAVVETAVNPKKGKILSDKIELLQKHKDVIIAMIAEAAEGKKEG